MKWLIRTRLAAFEKKLGYDFSYMRHMPNSDFDALVRFAKTGRIVGIGFGHACQRVEVKDEINTPRAAG